MSTLIIILTEGQIFRRNTGEHFMRLTRYAVLEHSKLQWGCEFRSIVVHIIDNYLDVQGQVCRLIGFLVENLGLQL